jgi:hypothetical protein
MVDPYNNQKLTYSEVVHLLSSHMIPATVDHLNSQQEALPTDGVITSVLEKFVNMRSGGAYLDSHLSQSHSRKSGVGREGGQEDIRQMIMAMRNKDIMLGGDEEVNE